MRAPRGLPVSLVILLAVAPVWGQTAVGRIAGLSGDVRLDAFGKGAFITAVVGDRLYRESVLRVAADATADLEIGPAKQTAAPGSVLKVADLLTATERRSGLRWTDALGKLVNDARRALQGKPGEVALGSRAANQGEETTVDWAEEEDETTAVYESSVRQIETGDTASGLMGLLSLPDTPTDAYTTAEIELWRGYGYFELGAYTEAETRLESARRAAVADPAALDAGPLRMLHLALGATRFYLGRPADAVSPLRALVKGRPADERTLFGYLFLVEALVATGDRTGGAAALREAEALYPGGAEAAELAALKRKLSL